MNTLKFKKGDWIKRKKDGCIAQVVMLLKTCYSLRLTDGDGWCLDYDFQDNWELTDAPPKNNLEEAAEEYIAPIENDAGLEFINFSGKDIKDAFIAGAKWQKEQMMEDAVECDVVAGSDGGKHLLVFIPDSMPMIDALKIGDKSKIIIVKEDEQ